MTDIVSAELLASDTPIAFFGYARAKDGCLPTLMERMSALGDTSRREPGVLVYEIHQDETRPDSIAFYELYANGAALQYHLEQKYTQQFFAESTSLLESSLEIHPLEPIRSASPSQSAR
jgi:quinol monooxygenase YgiN